MSTAVVVGTQWGDEGKGKITDYLAEKAEVVARYQGGNNAGHTIVYQGTKYKLHLVPSGIINENKLCVLGNGMVIHPEALIREIDYLHSYNIRTDNLRVSDRAHCIMPYHIKIDLLSEAQKGHGKIGTTGKGIGPAYMDKMARIGIRMGDLLDAETFSKKLKGVLEEKNHLLQKVYKTEGFSFDEVYESYMACIERLRPYITDTSVILNEAIDKGSRVLFEGAQGVMLDIDHGTYPFVTSSNPIAGGVCIGSGVGPTRINQVIGVAKAYTTRVGDGPFPTELKNEIGDRIREVGKEYGTTTGRPRRVGWFDSVVVRHARRVSGITGLSLNSLDVLTGLNTVKICTAYEYEGRVIENYPSNLELLEKCIPIYEEFPGWDEDITQVKSLQELPLTVQRYVSRITELTGIPLTIFSVGPGREQTIQVRSVYECMMEQEVRS